MKVVIPTAGEGKRLRPFTHTLPKVLLQVADKPILGHILDKLLRERLTDVTFVIGYMGDKIEAYVRREYPALRARFVVQEEARSGGAAPYGLGYAIHLTHAFHEKSDEPLLIILGDTVLEADLSALRRGKTTLIGVQEVPDPQHFGVVELRGRRISAMVEKPKKPPTNLAVVGIYYITKPPALYQALRENVQRGVRTQGEIQLTDALQRMIDGGIRMESFKVDAWYDCGTPETLLSTNRALLRNLHMGNAAQLRRRFPTALIKPPVHVAPSAKIAHSIIGPDVAIAENVLLSSSVVSDSIINAGAQVHSALLSHSIIGNEALVAGTALRLYVGHRSEIKFE